VEKALAYVRVSTTEQAREGVSLEAQEERIRAYCQMSGLSLMTVIREEAVSAAKLLANRPGGQEMTSAVAAKRVGHVVALKLDRLFRDAADALNQTRAWDRAGVALHLVDMGGQTLNTATAMGRMFLTMTAAFAELERNLIAERTQAALLYKKSKLQVYGAVPYGYSRYGDALRVTEMEFSMVRRIQDWHRHGWSLRKIADTLNRRRVRTKRSRRWHASTVRYILRNSLHISSRPSPLG
jgi:DNA invertase Pin-like site-specific DNA recombinase